MKNSFTEHAYSERLDSLFKKYPSFAGVGSDAYKPGLDHIRNMCASLGNPQEAFPSIHVAGTNGKGSTCNMLTASLAMDALAVGLYTSPHILDFRERIRIVTSDGVTFISKQEVWDFLDSHEDDFEKEELSFFEITTAMAFDFFARHRVDIAVIETGLGGRLDATNIIVPELSVITNIGLDHMDILGGTRALIAAEKAGIIKPGVPCVVGESDDESRPVFEKIASECGSRIVFADDVLKQSGQLVDESVREAFEILHGQLDLRGSYQMKNLATVLCALHVLGRKPNFEGIRHAAAICHFHGRWETILETPHTIGDIGHNEHGLKYNFSQLEDLVKEGVYSDLVMVYGSVSDKDVEAVLRLLPESAYVYFTAAANKRAMSAETLFEMSGHACGEVVPCVADAVEKALERCSGLDKPLLYIGGSTYVLAEALDAIGRRAD